MKREIIFFLIQYSPMMKVLSLFATGIRKCNLDMEYHFVLTEMFIFFKFTLRIWGNKT